MLRGAKWSELVHILNFPPKLRPGEASALTGLGKTTLQRWEKEKPGFPKPVRPTPRVTLYDRDKLLQFIDTMGEAEPAAEAATA